MRLAALLFLVAAPVMQFHITDGRGKETSAVTIDVGAPDQDAWRPLKIGKAKGDAVLVWPFDAMAKPPDGPEPVPAIVIQRGQEKALSNRAAMAAIATPVVLGVARIEDVASKTGFTAAALMKAFADLATADDAFEKGVGLLYTAKYADAADALSTALRERQRQLTRVPSDIYPAAMLAGLALTHANKFDEAAVAYLAALKQRPSDATAAKLRDEALVKAGKPEAAGR
jgi:tetratricopeptide (TPR) repeat protein